MIDRIINKFKSSQTFLVATLIIGIIVIAVLGIISILYTWMPKNRSYEELYRSDTIGYYKNQNISSEYMINKYSTELFDLLNKGNIDNIFENMSTEYIDFYNLTKQDIFNKLNNKNLLKNDLILKDYLIYAVKRDSRVIQLTVSDSLGITTDKIILIEENINDFKICLDGFISDKVLDEEYLTEGVQLNLKRRTEYTTKIIYDIELENVSDHDIILNYSNQPESVYITLYDGSNVRTSTIWFGSNTKDLKKGSKLIKEIEFKVPLLQGGRIYDIYIEDVYDTLSNESKNIYFSKFN